MCKAAPETVWDLGTPLYASTETNIQSPVQKPNTKKLSHKSCLSWDSNDTTNFLCHSAQHIHSVPHLQVGVRPSLPQANAVRLAGNSRAVQLLAAFGSPVRQPTCSDAPARYPVLGLKSGQTQGCLQISGQFGKQVNGIFFLSSGVATIGTDSLCGWHMADEGGSTRHISR